MSTCEFSDWCKGGRDGHSDHFGVVGTAEAGDNKVGVYLYLDVGATNDGDVDLMGYSFDLNWEIRTGDVERELGDLRSLLDQIEAIIVAAEKTYLAKWQALAEAASR